MTPVQGLIRRARVARGLSRRELAELVRQSPTTLSCNERVEWPSLTSLKRYADALGYELHVYFEDPETRERIT